MSIVLASKRMSVSSVPLTRERANLLVEDDLAHDVDVHPVELEPVIFVLGALAEDHETISSALVHQRDDLASDSLDDLDRTHEGAPDLVSRCAKMPSYWRHGPPLIREKRPISRAFLAISRSGIRESKAFCR